jgi:hypothetical protein
MVVERKRKVPDGENSAPFLADKHYAKRGRPRLSLNSSVARSNKAGGFSTSGRAVYQRDLKQRRATLNPKADFIQRAKDADRQAKATLKKKLMKDASFMNATVEQQKKLLEEKWEQKLEERYGKGEGGMCIYHS